MTYTTWLKLSIFFLLISGLFHSVALFAGIQAENAAEKNIIDLMNSYHIDAGAGFKPTFMSLFTALSSCFTLIYLLGGVTMWFLLRKKVTGAVLKGMAGIYVIFFGASFVIMLFMTFLLPVIFTGLTFISLLVTYLRIPTDA